MEPYELHHEILTWEDAAEGYSKGKSVLRDKSYQFALEVIKLCKQLQAEEKDYVMSRQVLRSGTAVGALLEEAGQAESRADFVHKLAIASKEASETSYWLHLLRDSSMLETQRANELILQCEELVKMLVASIKTAKNHKTKN